MKDLLEIDPEVQYMTWRALWLGGWSRCWRESSSNRQGIVDGIAARKQLVSKHDAEKRVGRVEGPLATHGD
jgi:hypothetical protein